MLNGAFYSVKSEDIRAAALFELAEAAIDNEQIEGLTGLAHSVLTSETFDRIVPILAASQHVQLNLMLEPLNVGMPSAHQRLWMESIYEFYCAHNSSLKILLTFFPELTRRKHEKYMKRNVHLLMSKSMHLTLERQGEVQLAFKELLTRYAGSDVREIYMMLQERFVDIAMTTLVNHTLTYLPGSARIQTALKSKSTS